MRVLWSKRSISSVQNDQILLCSVYGNVQVGDGAVEEQEQDEAAQIQVT